MLDNIINFIFDNSPIIALIFFISVFAFVVFNLLKPKQGKKYQDYANIPFKDNDNGKNDKK